MNEFIVRIKRRAGSVTKTLVRKFFSALLKFNLLRSIALVHIGYLFLKEKDYVVVGLASIPSRKDKLEKVLSSICWQADEVHVYLNGYDSLPSYLENYQNVHVFTCREGGDLNDRGKFYSISKAVEKGALFLTLDDDIYYPKDYVKTMMVALAKKYNKKAAIGVHGVFYPKNTTGFFDRSTLHFSREVVVDTPVSLLGTGTLGFYPSEIDFSMEDMPTGGKADIWFALKMKKNNIPMIVLSRRKGWLSEISSPSVEEHKAEDTLYLRTKKCSKEHDQLIAQGYPWGGGSILRSLEAAGVSHAMSSLVLQPLKFLEVHEENIVPPSSNFFSNITNLIFVDALFRWVDFYAKGEARGGVYKVMLEKSCGGGLSLYRRRIVDKITKADSAVGYEVLKGLAEKGELKKDGELSLLKLGRINHKAYESASVIEKNVLDVSYDQDSSDEVWLNTCFNYIEAGRYDRASSLFRRKMEVASQYKFLNSILGILCAAYEYDDAAFFSHASSMMEELASIRTSKYENLLNWLLIKSIEFDRVVSFSSFKTEDKENLIRKFKCLRKNEKEAVFKVLCEFDIKLHVVSAEFLMRPHERDIKRGRDYISLYGATTTLEENAASFLNSFFDGGLDCSESIYKASEGGFFSKTLVHSSRNYKAKTNAGSYCNDKVSVVICAYNSEGTLSYSIESVVNQTYENKEIIIVDDGSADGTVEIARYYEKKYPFVKVIVNTENLGPYESRNVALKSCSGKYFALQDADDFSHPERLSKQVHFLQENPNAVVALGRHIRADESGKVRLENNGSIIGDGPMTLFMEMEYFEKIGRFLPVRTRGDMEFYSRVKAIYGKDAVSYIEEVLLLSLHSRSSNSFVMTSSEDKKRTLSRFRQSFSSVHRSGQKEAEELVRELEVRFGCKLV